MTQITNKDDGWSFDTIKDTLVTNASCEVLYLDENGQQLTATCTLDPTAIPADAGEPYAPRSADNPVHIRVNELSVWNLGTNQWTRFDMNNVVSINYGV